MLRPVTTTDAFLAQISGQLAQQNELLGRLAGALAPESPAEPDPAPADDKPAKAPVKKAAAKSTRKVTGQ